MKDIVKNTARSLRKNQTKSEELFWRYVRNRNLFGKKFLRQHPIQFKHEGRNRFFIADFYCAENRTIIEIDGKVHDEKEEYDNLRTFIINNLGINVIRIKN